MCEFKVYLDGKKVFEDVIYIKSSRGKIILKSILGEIKELENCQIVEVNVNLEKLTLESRES